MKKERFKSLYNSGIMEAWVNGKTIQRHDSSWQDVSDADIYDAFFGTESALRIKPKTTLQTIEWTSIKDDIPMDGSVINFKYLSNPFIGVGRVKDGTIVWNDKYLISLKDIEFWRYNN